MTILTLEDRTRIVKPWGFGHNPGDKFARNAAELPRYASIEREFKRKGVQLVRAFEDRTLTKSQFIRGFRDLLRDAETDAFIAGKRARGHMVTDINRAELDMLAGRHSRNMRFAHAFADDIEQGRGRMDYDRRVKLYGDSLWSIYTRAETVDWDDPDLNARYYWILDPDAEHCPDCIERAKKSRDNDGFTYDELSLMGWPGEKTLCQVKCRCHVRVVRKRVLVADRAEDAEIAPTGAEGVDILSQLIGSDFMLPIPASGLPYVKVDPTVVDQAAKIESLARSLPVVPKTLIHPVDVHVPEPDQRLFIGPDVNVLVERSPEDGRWWLIGLIAKWLGLNKEK